MGFDASVYEATTGFNSSAFPTAFVRGDFNADGAMDIAASLTGKVGGAYRVSVMLNSGGGNFAPPAYYTIPHASSGIAAADLDGDGDTDLLAAQSGNPGFDAGAAAVSLLKNNGNGTFAAAVNIPVGAAPYGITTFDFEGDGDQDFVSANFANFAYGGTTITVKINNGVGTFTTLGTFACGAGPLQVAAGDLNGDLKPDLAVARTNNQLAVLMNTGSSFAPAVNFDLTGYTFSGFGADVAISDIDRDGDRDLVYICSSSGSSAVSGIDVLRNDGTGTFGPKEVFPYPLWGGGFGDLEVADVSGDGWVDALVVGQSVDSWTLMPGDGTGGFRPGSVYPSAQFSVGITSGDVDRDGDRDVMVLNYSSLCVTVHDNRGAGNFAPPPSIATRSWCRTLDAADIDQDGDIDIVAGGDTEFYRVRNQGDGSFGSPEIFDFNPGAQELKLADLNGDQFPDLLWIPPDIQPPYHFYTALNQGNGQFAVQRAWQINTCGNSDVEACDIDGDGDLDVAVTEWLGCPSEPTSGRRLFLARNDGNATFTLLPALVLADVQPSSVTSGDYNRDGHLDLALGTNPKINILPGNGNFSFGAVVRGNATTIDLTSADVNNDGILDLVGAVPRNDGAARESLAVLTGVGDGTFRAPLVKLAEHSPDLADPQMVLSADVDQDGFRDAMIVNYAGHSISYFTNQSGAGFADQVRYGLNGAYPIGGPLDGVSADFDGDGVPDVAAVSAAYPGGVGSGAVVFLFGTSDVGGGDQPVLTQTALVRGSNATFTVTGAQPGETVYFYYSFAGVGGANYCPPEFGGLCLDLLAPVVQAGAATADAAGIARLNRRIPPSAPLRDVSTQAAIARGVGGADSVKSNTVTAPITR